MKFKAKVITNIAEISEISDENGNTITDIDSEYPVNFEVKGTVTETVSNNQGTTSTTKDYTGEVVNEYTLNLFEQKQIYLNRESIAIYLQ